VPAASATLAACKNVRRVPGIDILVDDSYDNKLITVRQGRLQNWLQTGFVRQAIVFRGLSMATSSPAGVWISSLI
jgi:hypothetical protein